MLLIKASLTTMAAFQMTYLFFLHVVRTVATHTKYDCCTQCAYNRDILKVISLISTPLVPPIQFHRLSRWDVSFAAEQKLVGKNSQKSMLACLLRNTTGCRTASKCIWQTAFSIPCIDYFEAVSGDFLVVG